MMAIPKRGSRKIVVDGEEYRWLIRRKATYNQTDYGSGYLNVAVEHACSNGSVLVIYTDKPHPKDWATTSVEPVTPQNIKTWIKGALQIGWTPKEKGAQFEYNS